MTLRIALFTLATEVFREQADKDYIAARSCYRMNLCEQFLWASLQACEKYLKGILLFNERSARYDSASYDPLKKRNKEFGHDAARLFAAARIIADLSLDKPDWLPEFLKYLTAFGNKRILTLRIVSCGIGFDGSGRGARVHLGGPRQCLRVDILPDVRQFTISNGYGEDPMVLERIICGDDSPLGKADDHHPVALRYEFGGLWVGSFQLGGGLLKQIR